MNFDLVIIQANVDDREPWGGTKNPAFRQRKARKKEHSTHIHQNTM